MFTKLSKAAVSAAVLASAAVAMATAAPASAVSAPLKCARTAVHFDLAKGQTPENVTLAPDGTAYVTLAKARQIAAVSRGGSVRILATLPEPADGGVHTPALGFPLTTGIVRAHDGTLYFLYATGTADLTGVCRQGARARPRAPRARRRARPPPAPAPAPHPHPPPPPPAAPRPTVRKPSPHGRT
ncbi:hypothetical protein ACFXPJ_31190, partial [Streptomyces goshikiensis]